MTLGKKPALGLAILGLLVLISVVGLAPWVDAGVRTGAWLLLASSLICGTAAILIIGRRLIKTRNLLRVTLDSLADAVIATDALGHVTFLNPVAESLTGWKHADAAGVPLRSVLTIVDEGTGEPVESPFERIVREKAVTRLPSSTMLISRNGRKIPIEDLASPVWDDGAKIAGAVLAFRDVTDLRQVETEAREKERRLQSIFDHSNEGIFIVDPHHDRIHQVNSKTCSMLEYAAEDLLHLPFSALFETSAGKLQALIETVIEKGHAWADDLTCVSKTGRPIPVEIAAGSFVDSACDSCIIASVRDVSERKQMEAVLRMKEARLGRLTESNLFGISYCDRSGRIREANDAFIASIGYTRSDLSAGHVSWPTLTAPEHRSDDAAAMEEARLTGACRVFEKECIRKDGDRVPLLIGYAYLHEGPIDYVCFSLDLTTRKHLEAELRHQTEQLMEAHRKKDAFLATLAHELRDPLAPLRNSLQLMKVAGNDVAALGRARRIMERQLELMVHLVDDLLDISRITRGKIELRKQRVAVKEILEGAAEMSRPVIQAAGLELVLEPPRGPLFVLGDPMRLSQVVTNLLNNAAKYSREGERIWLAVQEEPGESNGPGQVAIRVTDTGTGIAEDLLPHVFDMFVQGETSLKDKRSGQGIGLSLVKRLVEMHGGTVEAKSAGPGKGSEFIVRLPLAMGAEETRPAESKMPPVASTPRRVLVVDDNVDSAESLGMLLKIMGNDVCLAHDGPTALKAAMNYRPDVVLLDIGLPVMNGYEVARRIRERCELEGVMLAALTGWGSEDDRRRSHEAGFDHHLVKPVDLAALLELLATSESRPSAAEDHGGAQA